MKQPSNTPRTMYEINAELLHHSRRWQRQAFLIGVLVGLMIGIGGTYLVMLSNSSPFTSIEVAP